MSTSSFSHLTSTELGYAAETRVAAFLQRQGYGLLERNLTVAGAEVDLVLWDGELEEVVFVEVKWRFRGDLGHPALAVDRRKLSRLERVAGRYMAARRARGHAESSYRFDIVSISSEHGLEHFENISWEY